MPDINRMITSRMMRLERRAACRVEHGFDMRGRRKETTCENLN
jgi:hypothetical protein